MGQPDTAEAGVRGAEVESSTNARAHAYELEAHSQFMTKIQVGHVDKSWSNLGQLRFDQDFTS